MDWMAADPVRIGVITVVCASAASTMYILIQRIEERPSKILDQVERVTRSKVRKFFKVQWEHHTESEATWEQEEFLKNQYPEWFSQETESRG